MSWWQRWTASRRIAVWAVFGVLLLGAECKNLVPAIGASGSLTLITHLPSGHAAQAALQEVLERDVVLVRPEPAFRLETVNAGQLNRLRHARNLVLMVDLSRSDKLAQEAERLMGERLTAEMRAGRRFYVIYDDVWATGQTVTILASTDPERLARNILDNGDLLFQALDRRVIRQSRTVVFTMGEQLDFSRYLERRFGWTMRIPRGYTVSEDDENRVTRFLMVEGGVRLLFVHWRDGVRRLPPVDELADLREEIAYRYDEDTILRDRLRSERVDWASRRVTRLEGVWQNERYVKGGPFRTYCFVDDGRLYMIDLVVFSPDRSKVDLMRQVEAIASTFQDKRQ